MAGDALDFAIDIANSWNPFSRDSMVQRALRGGLTFAEGVAADQLEASVTPDLSFWIPVAAVASLGAALVIHGVKKKGKGKR